MKKMVSLFFVLMCSCFTMSHAFSEFDKKVEGAKGAEYYILGADLSEQLVKRLSSQIHNCGTISGHRTTGPELLKYKYERDDYYGISKDGHLCVQVEDRFSWDYNKYVCEEQMPEEFSGEDRDTGIVHRYKRASRGIVSVNGFDFADGDEAMDGAKVFVPAVRSGELTPEQFKMQLKMGEAVNKGFIEDRFELNKMRGSAQFIEEFNFVEDIDEPIIKESDKNINMTRRVPRPSRNLRPVQPVFNKKEIGCENAPLSYIVKTKVSTTINNSWDSFKTFIAESSAVKNAQKIVKQKRSLR
ncbi:MAG: hypothetical protein LBB37_03825 [Endomicrobium sp.]|jgi:hypothetical protein|nr:hypothetical protein [Endomicrobium sp.]